LIPSDKLSCNKLAALAMAGRYVTHRVGGIQNGTHGGMWYVNGKWYVTHRMGGHAYRMGGIHTEWVVIQNGWLEGM
jgi:hypothetical protein